MTTKQLQHAKPHSIERECPHCGSHSIKFGKQLWPSGSRRCGYRKVQRMKCKECHKLWYYAIEPVCLAGGVFVKVL